VTTQWERKVLEQLGNVNRGTAVVNEAMAAILQALGYEGARRLRREDLREMGHRMVSLAGILTDLGVEMAADTTTSEADDADRE
jgi:hypothetical protein